MMKLTQNHQLARAESDPGLVYMVCVYVYNAYVLYLYLLCYLRAYLHVFRCE